MTLKEKNDFMAKKSSCFATYNHVEYISHLFVSGGVIIIFLLNGIKIISMKIHKNESVVVRRQFRANIRHRTSTTIRVKVFTFSQKKV